MKFIISSKNMSRNGPACPFFDVNATVNVIFENLNRLHGDMAKTDEFDLRFVTRMKIQENNIKVVEKACPNLCPHLQESLRTELENCQYTLKKLKEDDIFFDYRLENTLKKKPPVTEKKTPMSKKQQRQMERQDKLPGNNKKK